jgi:serine/threonine protein kinase
MMVGEVPPPVPTNCPAPECWEALFDDRVPPDQRAAYECHLGSCTACQRRLDRADDADDVLRRLGRQTGDPADTAADPILQRVWERLRRSVGTGRPGPAAVDLNFLRPCPRPGALGALGPYEVEEVLGRGGMGIVLRAFDPALHRHVALKVLAPALAVSGGARQRFAREVRAVAAVRHPHIVTVHGVHEADGLPYLVMEYVAGESLQDRLDRTGPLDPAEVVRIGLQAASGLAAAHAQGLIHRDVKPANLLLQSDADRVKITDFGLARTADDVPLTQSGVVAGTPEYMAPEQARGQSLDPRADLFSLGSVLYALCAGVPPFRGGTALDVLGQVSDQAPASLRALNPAVPAWLEEFIARLMARDPADRIQTAAGAAALLEGYLAHLRRPGAVPAPVLSPGNQGRRAKRRRALALAFVLAGGLLLVLGGLGAPGGWRVLLGAGAAAPEPDNKAGAGNVVPPPRSDVWSVAVSRDGRFVAAGAGWWDAPGEVGVWDLAARKPLRRFEDDRGVGSVAFSPDGKLLASASWGGHARLHDWAAGQELADFQVPGKPALAFSPDGALLAVVSEGQTAQLWDVAGRKLAADLQGELFRFQFVAFSPDGTRVLAGGGDWKPGGVNQVVGWDVASKLQVLKLVGHGNAVTCLAYSPDGKVIASGSVDKTIRLWDAGTGKHLNTLHGHTGWVERVAFTADGKTLVSCGHDHTIRFWDVEGGGETGRIDAMPGEVRAMALTPDDTTLIAGGVGKTLKVFDVATRQEVASLWGGAGPQPAAMDSLPPAAPEAGDRTWLVAGVFLAVVLGLAVVGLKLWQSARKRGPAAAPAAGDRTDPAVVPDFISLSCPDCKKTLKVRPALCGKRVKCPGCGQAVRVPAAEAGEPGQAAVD